MNDTSGTQTASVPQGLYLDILTGIISGEYPPKSTLPTEGRLARDYGISRSVVRSALEMLKKRGIVQSQQGSGTVVACNDPQKLTLPDLDRQLPELLDCYACRLAVEPEIAAQLANWPSGPAIAYLGGQLQGLDAQQQGGPNAVSQETASDAEFHIRLARYSGNCFFASIMTAMRPHMLFSMNIRKHLSKSAQKDHINLSRLEHRKIIAAILDRDAGASRKFMCEHIANGRDRLFPQGAGSPGAFPCSE